MIGGDNMYMPLCRECHRRESRINAANAYEGDPSKIFVEIESGGAYDYSDKNKTRHHDIVEAMAATPEYSIKKVKTTP